MLGAAFNISSRTYPGTCHFLYYIFYIIRSYNFFLFNFTAENIATKYGITREEQDKYALESQIKTKIAQKEGYFKREIVPVKLSKRKNIVMVSEDEFPKHDTTMESLRRLEPVFVKVRYLYVCIIILLIYYHNMRLIINILKKPIIEITALKNVLFVYS